MHADLGSGTGGTLDATLVADAAAQREEIIGRAAALRDQLWEDAASVDRDRDLSERNVAAIREAGLFRLMTPQRLGGLETDARTLLEVTREIGRGCGSSGWVTGILNASAFLLSLFPEQAQRDVWEEDPGALIASPIAPTAEWRPVDGGKVVTGQWGYASGSLHSSWVISAIPVGMGPKGPELELVLMPMRELQVKDTWRVTGMRGTGSNTIVAEEVFVADHRTLPFIPALNGATPKAREDEQLYGTSLAGILVLAILGPQLGLATAALDQVVAKAPGRMITATSYMDQSQAIPFQTDVAEASTRVDVAHLLARRAADTIDAFARRGEQPDIATRARLRMDCAWASHQCREALEQLTSAHGTSSFAEAADLQRLWRDQGIASRHAAFGLNPPKEMYGKALLGQDPAISFLL